MSTKKLTPRKRKLTSPDVPVEQQNTPVANGDYETDARNASDRDGNAAQARKHGTAPARRSAPQRAGRK